ncbi:YceI family protein [Corynebacterium sp. LK2510]|uniref:YceI family protein n=1 Tax=Corynebacterium sp. LK2510 TaxID=3110472 RepID=UPI0034CD21E1
MKPIENKKRSQKPIIVVGVLFIAALAALAFVPLIYAMVAGGGGVKTEGIDEARLKPASTDLDGTWTVTSGPGANQSSAGFTFFEILPAEEKVTSGSTRDVDGDVQIEAGTLRSGEISVDLTTLTTDSDVRDANVQSKILHTETYPEATFTLTEAADLTHVPDDGSIETVELTGDLTIHGVTNSITHTFAVARSGDRLLVAGGVPINRTDYGVETPDFVAAKIAEDGELNIRLNLRKTD